MDLQEKREIASKIAWTYLGTPYIWGGDDPMAGFDCSGFCIEILKSVGILPKTGDWTAHMLWEKFKDKEVETPQAGCLAFWTNSSKDKIVHVEYAINDTLSIGASGGGSTTTSITTAIDQNAYIKVRPIKSRRYLKGILDPFL
ncbi:MAG: C40 family peptidase [Desulfobacterales bacterium]|nr:C40 family peptidase [Desulfobacterales bacterium]